MLLLFGACFAGAVALQFANHAYEAELAYYPDESTHYVTGVMVREYVASAAATSPLDFAQHFYLRYPLLGLGHWPPGFYALLTSWALLFSGAKASLLALQAVLAAATGALVFRMVQPRFGRWPGVAAAALWLLAPTTQWLTAALMREPATALLCLLAAGAYARYLSRPGWRWSLTFGVLASVALLVQETAICLALVPPLAVVLTGRLRLMLRWDFWAAAATVGLLTGPWYGYVAFALLPGRTGSPLYRLTQVDTGGTWLTDLDHIAFLLGWPLTLIALGGCLLLARRAMFRDEEGDRAACWIALAVAAWTVQIGVPESDEPRHVLHSLPVLLLGLVEAGAFAARLVSVRPTARKLAAAGVAAALGAVFFVDTFQLVPKTRYGFDRVAAALLAAPELRGTAILVSSRQAGEGVLISELAMREPEPPLFVLRGQKALAKGGYRPRMESPEAVAEYLKSIPVAAVVLDDALSTSFAVPHHEMLRKALELEQERWKRVPLPFDGLDFPAAIKLYRLQGEDLKPKGQIELEVRRLRRSLSWDPEHGDAIEERDGGDLWKPPKN